MEAAVDVLISVKRQDGDGSEMPKTNEYYRVSLRQGGRTYKAFGHSVQEDETLHVRFRWDPRPRLLGSGTLSMTPAGLTMTPEASAWKTGLRSVHYHPSGRINVKQTGGTSLRLKGLPLPLLRAPVPIAMVRPASLEQLNIEDRRLGYGDHVIDLDAFDISRIQVEVQVGPKGLFAAPLMSPFGWCQRVLYEDAALYDVAYFIGAGPEIDATATICGEKLRNTLISAAPSHIDLRDFEVPDLPDAVWSTPPAIARQIRTFIESAVEDFRRHFGATGGAYEIRTSLCSDGAIAALDWRDNIDDPTYSFVRQETLSRSQVLAVLGAEDGRIVDVHTLNPALCGGTPRTVFVRRGASSPELVNAIVFNATEPPAGPRPYWRVPAASLKRLADIVRLVVVR